MLVKYHLLVLLIQNVCQIFLHTWWALGWEAFQHLFALFLRSQQTERDLRWRVAIPCHNHVIVCHTDIMPSHRQIWLIHIDPSPVSLLPRISPVLHELQKQCEDVEGAVLLRSAQNLLRLFPPEFPCPGHENEPGSDWKLLEAFQKNK